MRSVGALCAAAFVLLAVTGCSSDAKKSVSSATTSISASARSAATSSTGTQSDDAVDPSSMVTGSTRAVPTVAPSGGVSLAAPAQAQFAIGSQPFGPASVTSEKLNQSINASLPLTGVMAPVRAGMTVKPAQAVKPLAVVWMNDSSVLKLDQVSACSGSCADVKAPAGASKVMVIPQSQIPGIGVGAPVSAG